MSDIIMNIGEIKLTIGLFLLILVPLWFMYFVYMINLIKKIDRQRSCKLHAWEQKTVEIDGISSTYTVCSVCKNLAGTDMFEESV